MRRRARSRRATSMSPGKGQSPGGRARPRVEATLPQFDRRSGATAVSPTLTSPKSTAVGEASTQRSPSSGTTSPLTRKGPKMPPARVSRVNAAPNAPAALRSRPTLTAKSSPGAIVPPGTAKENCGEPEGERDTTVSGSSPQLRKSASARATPPSSSDARGSSSTSPKRDSTHSGTTSPTRSPLTVHTACAPPSPSARTRKKKPRAGKPPVSARSRTVTASPRSSVASASSTSSTTPSGRSGARTSYAAGAVPQLMSCVSVDTTSPTSTCPSGVAPGEKSKHAVGFSGRKRARTLARASLRPVVCHHHGGGELTRLVLLGHDAQSARCPGAIVSGKVSSSRNPSPSSPTASTATAAAPTFSTRSASERSSPASTSPKSASAGSMTSTPMGGGASGVTSPLPRRPPPHRSPRPCSPRPAPGRPRRRTAPRGCTRGRASTHRPMSSPARGGRSRCTPRRRAA